MIIYSEIKIHTNLSELVSDIKFFTESFEELPVMKLFSLGGNAESTIGNMHVLTPLCFYFLFHCKVVSYAEFYSKSLNITN